MAGTQIRNCGLYWGGGSGTAEQWVDLSHIFEVDLLGFAEGWEGAGGKRNKAMLRIVGRSWVGEGEARILC